MNIRPLLNLCATCATALLAGCASGPTHTFYKPTGRTDVQLFKSDAALIQSDDLRSDVGRYFSDGYVLVGTSDYNGSYPKMSELTAQAKRVGASVVVFNGKYIGTITGVSSFSLPNPSQTVTSQSSGNVYGYGGSASYSSTTTTTVPGGYTQYQVPYAIDRYVVHEAFLGKRLESFQKPPALFGLKPTPLSPAQEAADRLAETQAQTIVGLIKSGDMAGAKKVVDSIQDEPLKTLVRQKVGLELKQ